MMGKTHLLVGVILLFVLNRFTTILFGNELLAVFIILIASVLPDIDESKSILGKRFKLISKLSKHRGFFHSIFSMVMFTIIVNFVFNRNMAIVFLIGYAAHLFFDSISKQGTQLFYPNKLKIKGPFKVGGKMETIIFFVFIAVVIYMSNSNL